MAELLVRVVDKVNDDPYLDVRCTKAGDVIVVQENGWSWGKEEIANPEWRIVKVDSPVSECVQLLAPELPQTATLDRMVRKRAFRFDLRRYDAGERDVANLIIGKERLRDPNVVGDDRRMIG